MNKKLLIIGADTLAVVAYEIAMDMKCFEKIAFADDERSVTPNNISVIGKTNQLDQLVCEYNNVFVAVENTDVRLSLLNRIKENIPCNIVSLVSPKAYVSPSAQIQPGCLIEPMATVHSLCLLTIGAIVSAGAVVNTATIVCDGAHIDCNATVAGHTLVPAGMKISAGETFKNESINANDLFFDPQKWEERMREMTSPHTPTPINGKVYSFDDVM